MNLIKNKLNKGYQAEKCALCNKSFSLLKLNRVHKCKRCMRFICSSCGNFRHNVLEQGIYSAVPKRVCYWCNQDISFIKKTIFLQEYQWDCNSKTSEKWLQPSSVHFEQEFQDHLHQFQRNRYRYQAEIDLIEKDVFAGRTDCHVYNPSLAEFLYQVQSKTDKERIREDIAEVLYSLVISLPKTGYCQGMSMVVAFLLCFCSKPRAFALFNSLVLRVFPEKIFNKSSKGTGLFGLLAQLFFITQAYKEVYKNKLQKPISPAQFQNTKTYIQLLGSRYFLTLGVGLLSFQPVLFLWNQIFADLSFAPAERSLLALIWIGRQFINQKSSIKDMELTLFRLNFSSLVLTYKDMTLSIQSKNQMLKQFNLKVMEQWNNGSRQSISKISSLTRFNQVQLQQFFQTFTKYCEALSIPGINRPQFHKLFRKWSQKAALTWMDDTILDWFFDSVNQDNNQYLDFREFTIVLSNFIRTTPRQKVTALLGVRSGIVQVKQADYLLSTVIKMLQQQAKLSASQMDQLKLLKMRVQQKVFLRERVLVQQLNMIQFDQVMVRVGSKGFGMQERLVYLDSVGCLLLEE